MSFDLQMGFVGTKEKFVARRYIEDEYKEQDRNTCLRVEKRHQNGMRGQFFDDIEDLLRDDKSLVHYESFEDYVKQDCGSIGYIDSLIMDNIDEDKSDNDFTLGELKEIVREYGDSEIIEALDNLKEDEKLYVLSDCNGEYLGTDKNSLILDNLADGQYERVYSNFDEILEAIEGNDELATVYIYNYMSTYEKDKYSEEYKKEQKLYSIFDDIKKTNIEFGSCTTKDDLNERIASILSAYDLEYDLEYDAEALEEYFGIKYQLIREAEAEINNDFAKVTKEVFTEHPSDVVKNAVNEIEKSDKKAEQKLN